MTFPDPSLERALEPRGGGPENVQDVIPPTERNQDPERTALTHGLALDGSRPLTDEEKKAADRDAPVRERVYAPASERVPVKPVAGHRDVVEHPDTHTPEREAAAPTFTPEREAAAPTSTIGQTSTMNDNSNDEPSFTRVARPSNTQTAGAYASSVSNTGFNSWGIDMLSGFDRRRRMFFGIGFSWFTLLCCGVGAWLFMRWRQERKKPINRLRRQARQAASELRDRVPTPEEAARPAMGLTTAIVSILLLVWQQAQARSRKAEKVVGRQARQASKSARRAAESMPEGDWQKRLMQLKQRWTPGRVELEKISISRH